MLRSVLIPVSIFSLALVQIGCDNESPTGLPPGDGGVTDRGVDTGTGDDDRGTTGDDAGDTGTDSGGGGGDMGPGDSGPGDTGMGAVAATGLGFNFGGGVSLLSVTDTFVVSMRKTNGGGAVAVYHPVPGIALLAPPARVIDLGAIEPSAGAIELSDRSILAAGFSTANDTAWVGRIESNGTATWQISLGEIAELSDIVLVDQNRFAATFIVRADSTMGVAELTTAGDVSSAVNLNNPEVVPVGLVTFGAGEFAVAGSIGMAPMEDAQLLRFSPGASIPWQHRLTGVSIKGIAATADMGLVAVGNAGGNGWIAKIDSAGMLVWQKSYAGAFLLGAVPNATGFYAYGTVGTALAVLQLDAMGAVTAIAGYNDTGAADFTPIGASLTNTGGLALGAGSSALSRFVGIVTEPDLSVPDCGDLALGMSIPAATVTVTNGMVAFMETALEANPFAAMSAAEAVVISETTAQPDDLCAN